MSYMKKSISKHLSPAGARCLLVSVFGVAMLFNTLPIWAADPTVRVYEGVNVTGVNRLFGEPLDDNGPIVGTFGFTTIAEYNPVGEDSIPLTPDTPETAILSLVFDEEFAQFFGLPPILTSRALKNTPLRQKPVAVETTGLQKQTIPGILEAGQLERSQREPANPVTLEDWFRAKGFISVVCPEDGPTFLQLSASGLLPNRLYELVEWVSEPQFKFSPIPVGGVPSLIMADNNGRATFRTVLNYCPSEADTPGENPTIYALGWHSDHQTNGGTVAAPRNPDPEEFRVAGQVIHAVLTFSVSSMPLLVQARK